MELAIALSLGLPLIIIGGVWAILRDLSRVSRVTTETKTEHAAGLDALRQELIKLRETTTEYDMSVEHNLSELRQRVDHIESRMEIKPVSTAKTVASPTPPRKTSANYAPPTITESETQSVTPGAS